MNKLLRQIGVLFLLIAGVLAKDGSHAEQLQCSVPAAPPGMENAVEPGSAKENSRLREAPHGAKRVSKRQLEVGWTGGKRIFKDKPPYDEPLAGTWWAYCGYSATLGYHLVEKAQDDLFTGVLLDDKTGKLLPGGEAVLFSPDHQYYLAYEQPDGQDGETLIVYKSDGTMVGKGVNDGLSPDGKSVLIDSENMRDVHWDEKNRIQATAYLSGGKTLAVTFTKGKRGSWEWLPKSPK